MLLKNLFGKTTVKATLHLFINRFMPGSYCDRFCCGLCRRQSFSFIQEETSSPNHFSEISANVPFSLQFLLIPH